MTDHEKQSSDHSPAGQDTLDRLDLTPSEESATDDLRPAADTSGPDAQEDILPDAPVLLLCGDSPESRATALLARQCGFLVDVVDDDTEDDNDLESSFPVARRCLRLPGFDHLVETCGIGREYYVAVMTREPELSCHVLAQALESPAAYVGMLGGRRKRDSIYDILREEGVPLAELAVVRCPIGLPIGAQSPQQVAVAIVAELLAARANTLQRMRFDE